MSEFQVQGPLQSFSFDLFGLHIIVSESIVVQWLVMLILGVLFFVLGRNLSVRTRSRRQMLAELIVTFFKKAVNDTMGEQYSKFTAYIGGLFFFSCLSSLMGLLGLRAPTADLSVVAAWGLTTFVLVTRNKFKTGGVKGYLKSFIEPMPFMLPFNIISEPANPVSQTLRHFANILGGTVISGLIYFSLGHIANGFATIGIPAIASLYFDLFSAVIQAYIFVTLTMTYIAGGDCSPSDD